ncbi:hypothetical protein [Sphaerospermopsis sp. FACHB-1194]|uniref:hypothetical protein n=1 Tax=Sphaerospermopsis sp. FACHB-1194 TaxID=2692862 RepID=UPI001681BB1C|nr:hypothetical protein [Sphaerospermopsis sp. FACHB-1194]MBD2144452.1 hypothetical protein [Sphaerospermopsis sp. FACHB-1194]
MNKQNQEVNLFTIGFTQKKAEQFFETLIKSGVKRVIDTRLNNVSQLAGFAKKQDLQYFNSFKNNFNVQNFSAFSASLRFVFLNFDNIVF